MVVKAFLHSILGLCFIVGVSANAQSISVELNKLEPKNDACRAYLVLQNSGGAFTQFKLDLVLFDAEGIVAKRLIVDASPLRANKTSVKLFDIAGLECQNIARVLINDVAACHDGTQSRTDCVELVEPKSAAEASLIK